MDEKLKATIEKIRQLAISNPEFDKEMRKMFGKQKSSAITISGLPKIQDDVTVIREVMEIRGNYSIDYSFIKNNPKKDNPQFDGNKRLREQLELDNYRMENASLNISEKSEDHRFYVFCVNAFYQVENIINYYYYIAYPKIEDLVYEIEQLTKIEDEKFQFKKNGREKNVSNIDMVHKINAFCNRWHSTNELKKQLSFLRIVRNNGEHRCTALLTNEKLEDEDNFRKFWKSNTFNSVRITLISLVEEIKTLLASDLSNMIKTTLSDVLKNNCTYKEAKIKTLLPSVAYLEFEVKTESVQGKLFSKLKGKKVGDTITIGIDINGRIQSVIV